MESPTFPGRFRGALKSVGGKVARSITADDVADILDLVTVQRGAPKYIRCDNGP
jgi:hypothetical protein